MIASLVPKRTTAPRRRYGRGWIGIDLQPHMIRFARVHYTKGMRTLEAAYTIDLSTTGFSLEEVLQHDALSDVFKEHRQDLQSFGSGQVAAVFPTSFTRLHQLELPQASRGEVEVMVDGELQDKCNDCNCELTTDYWIKDPQADSQTLTLETVSLPTLHANSVVNAIESMKWNCRVIDSRPSALSRLATSAPSHTTAVLEWGLDETTFVITENGLPAYTRVLRDCGLRGLIEQLASQTQLSPEECLSLLERMQPRRASFKATSEQGQSLTQWFSRKLGTLAKPLVQQIAEQLSTTLEFTKYRLGISEVQSVTIAGMGAPIHGASCDVQNQLNIPVEPWTLTADTEQPTSSDWGVSVALSEIGLR